ncbi:cobalt-factor II C(20)-methyltransferase [Clostridium autoethanogenum]|uniref:Cobalt-precorrin-2 C(20)-methyltransferase n=1 Tax=Clostridium autoethanogenum TaxID=84023 RepID=A0A3M0SK25_9CLOT|nr:cobalt-factor II C(20)-methyltransferase [Clostridium autoethanogenum]
MEKDTLKMGTLYGIGVGPGDEELLTLKAVNVIKKCEVIVAPSAKDGDRSIAFDTAKNFVDESKEVIIKHFPMGGKEQEGKIFEAFKTIEERLNEGKNVAFLTIGDPFVYSTYIYLLEHIKNKGYKTETVPGITSFCAAASLAGQSIVIGDERVLILPASQVDKITDEKFVVIMKVYRKEENVLDVLEEKGFKYVCVKRAYREDTEKVKNTEDNINRRN